MAEQKSLEQWARDLLELAVKEELVRLPRAGTWGESQHPQARSAGEMVAVANKLKALIVDHDERWHAGQLHRVDDTASEGDKHRQGKSHDTEQCGYNHPWETDPDVPAPA